MEHLGTVSYFALRPNVKAERTVRILLHLIIPFERANAYLKGDKFIDRCPQFLILLFVGVIFTRFLLHPGSTA